MNIRAKLRQGLSLRDLELTVEYFKRRKAENPNFFVKQVDADRSAAALVLLEAVAGAPAQDTVHQGEHRAQRGHGLDEEDMPASFAKCTPLGV